MNQLLGHVSPDTAFIVEDYPYGFRLRCRIRYWVETKPGFGQRFMSQTTNPKRGGAWNKPKAGTYHPLAVLVQRDNGHVHFECLSPYADEAELDAFAAAWTLDEHQQIVVKARKIAHARVAAAHAAVDSRNSGAG